MRAHKTQETLTKDPQQQMLPIPVNLMFRGACRAVPPIASSVLNSDLHRQMGQDLETTMRSKTSIQFSQERDVPCFSDFDLERMIPNATIRSSTSRQSTKNFAETVHHHRGIMNTELEGGHLFHMEW